MSRYKMVELGTLIQQAKTVRCGDGDYPVLSMTMHDGLVFQDDKFKKVIASKDRSDYKVVKRNQLVISFPIDEGVLAAQRIVDAGVVSPAYGIWDIDQEKVLPEFLEYALRCDRALSYYKAKLRGSTARRRSLPTPTLLAFTVPLPDIIEQKHILAVIHKVKSLISKRTEELKLLDNLTQARFVEMFGATSADRCSKRIRDYAEVLGGYAFKSDLFCADAIPVIRISNINNGCVELDYDICFDELFWEQNKRFRAKQNDILIAMSGATTGKAGIYKEDMPALINQRVACIRAKDGIACPMFLFVATQLEWMYDLIQETSAGCAQPNISGKQIENMPMPYATYEQQQRFAAFVEQTDKSKVIVQKALDEAQTLFDSLMQEYFG